MKKASKKLIAKKRKINAIAAATRKKKYVVTKLIEAAKATFPFQKRLTKKELQKAQEIADIYPFHGSLPSHYFAIDKSEVKRLSTLDGHGLPSSIEKVSVWRVTYDK